MPIISTNPRGAFPDVQGFSPSDIVPDALVLTAATPAAVLDGDGPRARIPYVPDDVAAALVPEGTDIAETDPEISELVVATKKVAVLSVLSREAYHAQGIQELITNSLRRSIQQKADAVFLANTTDPTGLVNTTGMVTGTITSSLDPVIDTLATLEANGGSPTHVLAAPDAWAALQKIKTTSGTSVLVTDPATPTGRSLFGLPVIVNKFVPTGTLLVTDRNEILSVAGQVLAANSTERYFETDSVALRVTFRFGFGVIHSDRLAKLTISGV